jgi:ferritin-like metal-binding protein YciE
MSMQSPQELFEHELEDIYYAENELLSVLSDLEEQTETEAVAEAFREHRDETETHVDRLEEVFDMIDKPPEETECEGINGLVEEHEDFLEEDPTQEILDLYNIGAAEKTEHYEISAYGNLAHLADQLNMDEAAELLGETLDEEKETLETLKELTEDYEYEPLAQ